MGCGKSKHAAIENSISRKSPRAGSKRDRTPETDIEKGRKLERNASSLMAEDGRIVISRKTPRAVHDEDDVQRTESKKQKKLDINDKNGDVKTSCEEQKRDVTENTTRVVSEVGEIPEIRIEEIFELDIQTNTSDGGNSEDLADGNGIVAEIEESEERVNTLETIEETSELDSDSISLMKEVDESVDQDSSSNSFRAAFDEIACASLNRVKSRKKSSQAKSKRCKNKRPNMLDSKIR